LGWDIKRQSAGQEEGGKEGRRKNVYGSWKNVNVISIRKCGEPERMCCDDLKLSKKNYLFMNLGKFYTPIIVQRFFVQSFPGAV
jgi:hypothetical protein